MNISWGDARLKRGEKKITSRRTAWQRQSVIGKSIPRTYATANEERGRLCAKSGAELQRLRVVVTGVGGKVDTVRFIIDINLFKVRI